MLRTAHKHPHTCDEESVRTTPVLPACRLCHSQEQLPNGILLLTDAKISYVRQRQVSTIVRRLEIGDLSGKRQEKHVEYFVKFWLHHTPIVQAWRHPHRQGDAQRKTVRGKARGNLREHKKKRKPRGVKPGEGGGHVRGRKIHIMLAQPTRTHDVRSTQNTPHGFLLRR